MKMGLDGFCFKLHNDWQPLNILNSQLSTVQAYKLVYPHQYVQQQ
jgi:hypothetical protein